MTQESLPPPVVSADRNLVELSMKAIVLGALLSMLLAAANAYIGLLVGLTVSASIPAAAAAMGVLRLFRRSTILENNMVQTSASAGEALTAGIIFTIPALVMMNAWSDYGYVKLTSIAILGGVLGVAFSVPLRRVLIVEARLAYPQGQATSAILKTGGIERDRDKGSSEAADSGYRWLLKSAGIGAAFKFLESGAGVLAGNVATSQAWLAGKYLFLANVYISPALLGVGYIVGLNIAVLVFIGGTVPRTESDTPINYVLLIVLLSTVPLYLIFSTALVDYPDRIAISIVMTALMLVFGFVFSSVAGYMAGLVGSSNNPISGITIATVVVSGLILLQLMGKEGVSATLGPIAVIYLAGLVCSSTAIAADNMQDLKCGHIVGATPWRQQLLQLVGVLSAATVIPIVLQLLDNQYGIGRPSTNPQAIADSVLAAPQAGLMQAIAGGMFGDGIQWTYIYVGCVLAVVVIALDRVQEQRKSTVRFPVLAVAVGIYLPFGLSIPVFAGGIIAWVAKRRMRNMSETDSTSRSSHAVLIASGLITGAALTGVLVALLAGAGIAVPFVAGFRLAPILALLGLVAIIVYLHRTPLTHSPDRLT